MDDSLKIKNHTTVQTVPDYTPHSAIHYYTLLHTSVHYCVLLHTTVLHSTIHYCTNFTTHHTPLYTTTHDYKRQYTTVQTVQYYLSLFTTTLYANAHHCTPQYTTTYHLALPYKLYSTVCC